MFWRLGFISAWRNLTRSILALVSMALAAGFMTNAISLSRGYVRDYRAPYRALIGGEVTAYSLALSAVVPQEGTVWQYQEMLEVGDTDLGVMMPEMFQRGYVATAMQRVPFTPERLQAFAATPSISSVYPRYQMPAYSSSLYGMWNTPLRGRNLELDQKQQAPLANYIAEGRWLDARDEGEMVAVVSLQRHVPPGERDSGVGDLLQIMVPRISYIAGRTQYAFDDPLLVELRVVGVLHLPTRSGQYGVFDPDLNDIRLITEWLYAQNDEIHLPLATWQKIWELAGGEEFQPQQVAMRVEDLSYLEDIVAILRLRYPDNSFYSVHELMKNAEGHYGMEKPEILLANRQLAEYFMRPVVEEQTVLAQDLRLPLIILIFVNAAMIIASNLLIMVSERKKEIGILKAVGATRSQVVQMVLSEALLVSLLGSLVGFVFFRVPAILTQITNRLPLTEILAGVVQHLSLVSAVACVSSLIFGMLPAMTMANLTANEILQAE
ncbi:MAG: ABC transporter permease [Symbiobacteriaceae bacterium]|nr:ABC transporter permease [Symbiobacteriaceae bacterium]